MENSSSIFKKLDEYVFSQVENFKTSSTYQQFMDQFSSQDDSVQKYSNHVFAFLLVLIPIFLCLFFGYKNIKLGKALNIKRKIYISLGETSIKSKRLSLIEKRILGPRKITSQAELQDLLNAIIRSGGLKSDKIRILKASTSDLFTNLGRLTATIKFSGLSTPHLTNFLRDLIKKEKMVIPKLKINKNKVSELLEGEIQIHHHYRLK